MTNVNEGISSSGFEAQYGLRCQCATETLIMIIIISDWLWRSVLKQGECRVVDSSIRASV